MRSQRSESRKRARKNTTIRSVERLEGRALLASIAEFGGLAGGATPSDITTGSDGNLWFTENQVDKIGRLTPAGVLTEFPLASGSYPQGITSGPDGKIWFAENASNKIGNIDPNNIAGGITEYSLALSNNRPGEITAGPDGNLWFTDLNDSDEGGQAEIGRITTSGVETDYALSSNGNPSSITAGPDGNLWFADRGTGSIGQITTAGIITEFSIGNNNANPGGITTGSDGNLWFTDPGNDSIGKATTAGVITEYAINSGNGYPTSIVSGPDGDLFYTLYNYDELGESSTAGTVIATYPTPTSSSRPEGITIGLDHHVWFAESGTNQIGRLNLNPVAVNDSYTATSGVTLNVNSASGVMANDADPEGDSLILQGFSSPSHGSFNINNDGSFNYTPSTGYVGPDSFVYQISDGTDLSTYATVTINVDARPVAVNDNYTTPVSTTLTVSNAAVGVIANDTDPNIGHTLTASVVAQPNHGTVTLNANGTFTYIPTTGYHGSDFFTYLDTDSDGVSASNAATVNLSVDTPPLAVADTYYFQENTTLNISAVNGILANDTDSNPGFALTPHLVASVNYDATGGFTLNADGSFSYTPHNGSTYTDSFTYYDSDGIASGNTVTVTLEFEPPPTAVNDSYVVAQGGTLSESAANGVLANDSGDGPLTAMALTNPSNGTLTLETDGSFTYIPAVGFYGTDSFTYQDQEGSLLGNTATVTIAVDAPPVAVDDTYDTPVNGTINMGNPSLGLEGNDSDSNLGHTFTSTVVSQPLHGAVELFSNGTFYYLTASNFHGIDTFTYQDTDSDGVSVSNTATVSIIVDGAPVAVNDSYTAQEQVPLTVTPAGGVLANDTDPDEDPLTALFVSGPAHGTLTFNPDGSYIYLPNSSFGASGSDSFTYRAFDGVLTSNIATVTLTFDGTYFLPVAQPQAYAVAQGTTLTESAQAGLLVGANDYWSLPLTAVVTAQPTHGTLSANPDGSFSYTPNPSYFGPDSFTYEVANGQVSTDPITVTLSVTHVNQPPVASNQAFSTVAGNSPLTLTEAAGLLSGVTDPDLGDTLTVFAVTQPAHGSLALNADGSFTYTPTQGYFGTDTFTYRASDGQALSSVATATLTINRPARIVPNDYDGDGKSDIAVYIASMGAYDIHYSSGFPDQIIPFGTPGLGNAIPAPGDYDHSGKTELAVYYPEGGQLIYRPADGGADVVISIGLAGLGNTVPAPGDYFGTGQDDVAVYVPSLGAFEIRNPSTGVVTVTQFGGPNVNDAIPAPGDYDGSGKTEVALYIPSAGLYAFRPAAGYADQIIPFGAPGLGQTIPIPGDYDDSGHDELAVYMPEQGRFAYRPGYGGPDVSIVYGVAGAGRTRPSPGDYTGVGHDQLAAYIPEQGIFAIRLDNGQPDLVQAIGTPGPGVTSPVTVVDEALAQMPDIVSILSLDWPGTKKKGPGH